MSIPTFERHVVLFSQYEKFAPCMMINPESSIPLIIVAEQEMLPFSKSVTVKKPYAEYTFTSCDKKLSKSFFPSDILPDPNMHVKAMVPLGEVNTTAESHRSRITVTVDAEKFPVCQVEPIIIDGIRDLPTTLAKTSTKLPVIGFFDQCSVICVYQAAKNGYKFLNEWNKIYGRELFLKFSKEKPIFGEKAVESFKTKSTFVVHDIVKIMSMPPDAIEKDENWNFTLTHDAENPVLLEFDNYDGCRKCSPPEFLMALLLKEHIKVIKNEIGEKPEEVAFCLFDEFAAESEVAKKRVQKKLEEACELLKIRCSFIDV